MLGIWSFEGFLLVIITLMAIASLHPPLARAENVYDTILSYCISMRAEKILVAYTYT